MKLMLIVVLGLLVACSDQSNDSHKFSSELQESEFKKAQEVIKQRSQKPPADPVKDLEAYQKWLKETDAKSGK